MISAINLIRPMFGMIVWLIAVAGPTSHAGAENLVVSLSSPRVAITSTYIGTDLVIFGVIGRDEASATRSDHYDIVVSARGPRSHLTVRQKQPLGPFWVNQQEQKFMFVPATLAVASNRPLDEITSPDMQERYHLGLANIVIPSANPDRRFLDALIRLKQKDSLYALLPHHVEFITPNVFKAVIPVPARAPTGFYDVEVALFSDTIRLTSQSTHFEVIKTGFEQEVAETARFSAWFYGFATLLMAVVFGWLATIIFRRD